MKMTRTCNNNTCGVDISHKRAGARYCSRSCKDTEASRRNYAQKEAKRVEWRTENPDKVAAYKKKNKSNFGRAYAAKRRVSNASLTYDLDALKGMSSLAKRINALTASNLHLDHIEPLTNDEICGLNSSHNLQLLDSTINIKKSNKRDYRTPLEELITHDPKNYRRYHTSAT